MNGLAYQSFQLAILAADPTQSTQIMRGHNGEDRLVVEIRDDPYDFRRCLAQAARGMTCSTNLAQ